jgi:phospholipase B1
MAKLTLLFAGLAHAANRFNCTDFSVPALPTNVAKLHPGHVSIVMAMGDSITAAFAARAEIFEDRDLSWSIGTGSETQLTLPFMLQKYGDHAKPSVKVEGSSPIRVVPNPIDMPHNDYVMATDKMNVAQSEGSVGRNSLVEQWALLQKNFPKYENFANRWKILTIWMTANDVCGECNGPSNKIQQWGNVTDKLLQNISSTLKNVYVNLVSTLDLSNVARLQRSTVWCKTEHEILHECGCIDKGNATQLKWLDINVHSFNSKLHEIAGNWYTKLKNEGRTDMAVQLQAYQEGIGPTLDISFLNGLDCFHPSAEAHQDLAIGLWDSMLCINNRAGRCGLHFSKDLPILCPNINTVFYTGPDVIPGPPPVF